MPRKRITRRRFVGSAAAFRAPGETLNVACIGVGGMGKNEVKGIERDNIYALCDVEWIAACKGGAPAGSTFDGHAGGIISMVLLGCLAVRLGRVLETSPTTGQVTNVRMADNLISPTYRSGWVL